MTEIPAPVEPTRFNAEPSYSMATVHGGVAYFAGQVATDGSTSIEAQTRSALKSLDAQLDAVGATRSSLLSATIWLSDISNYEGMNDVWCEWLDGGPAPCRATAIVKLAEPEMLIEIIATAAV